MASKNTLQKGNVRYIVFKEDGIWYAVAMEFNIVEAGDSPQEAMVLLMEAVMGYVETAQKMKTQPHVLNQAPDSEYERMWKHREGTRHESKKPVFAFGEFPLNASSIRAMAMA